MGRKLVAILVAAVVALVGVAAVLLYARAADSRAVAGQQPVDVYIVKTIVPAGTTLKGAVEAGLIVKSSVARKGLPLGALAGVDGTNGGQFALSDLQPGEYVLGSRFGEKPVGTKAIEVPAGQVAVSISLADAARAGTFLTPGSHVVLFNTYEKAASATNKVAGPQTRVLLEDVLVIAVGDTSLTPVQPVKAGEVAPPPTAGALLTVALPPADAVRLVHGIQTGRLYAALRGTDAKIDLGQVASEATLFPGK